MYLHARAAVSGGFDGVQTAMTYSKCIEAAIHHRIGEGRTEHALHPIHKSYRMRTLICWRENTRAKNQYIHSSAAVARTVTRPAPSQPKPEPPVALPLRAGVGGSGENEPNMEIAKPTRSYEDEAPEGPDRAEAGSAPVSPGHSP